MLTINLCNGSIIIKSKMTLKDIAECLFEYSFKIKASDDTIICYGNCTLFDNISAAVHLYFDKKTEIINGGNITIYPDSFESVQKKLETQYGNCALNTKYNSYNWNFCNGHLEHQYIDRFGLTEVITFSFIDHEF